MVDWRTAVPTDYKDNIALTSLIQLMSRLSKNVHEHMMGCGTVNADIERRAAVVVAVVSNKHQS